MDSVGSFDNVDLSGIMEIIQDNIDTVKSVSIQELDKLLMILVIDLPISIP